MGTTCVVQFYYFQLGERNEIIDKIKTFMRSLKYLRNKPSFGIIFDVSLQYKSGKANRAGSIYIGEIAGMRGDTACYRHSHIHFFPSAAARQRIKTIKSSNSGFTEPTVVNSNDLLDVRELLRR